MKTNKLRAFKPVLIWTIIYLAGLPLRSQNLQDAIKLTESEQFEQADRLYNNLLKQDPHNGTIYFYLGENFIRSYFVDSANINFNEIKDSANKNFTKGSQEDPLNPLNFIGLGKLALLSGNNETAKTYFDKARALLPAKNLPTNKISQKDKAVSLMKMAEAFVQAGVRDTSMVFGILNEARKADPKNPEICIITGEAYMLRNDGVNSLAWYNNAQILDSKSPKAKMRIGKLWGRNRAYTEALSFYKEAIAIDSTFAPAYREIGDLYILARQYDNAILNYKKFLALSPGNLSAKIKYASALISAKDYEEALKVIPEIMKEDSSRNDLNRAMAYASYETGQYDKGLPYMKKFFKNAKAKKIMLSDYVYYGKLLAKNRMDSLAIEQFLIASKLDTANWENYADMGTSYSRLKNFDAAYKAYEKVMQLKKPSYIDYYNLGKAKYYLKEYLMADSLLGIVNQMQPGFIQGYFWRASANSMLDPDTKEGKAKPFYEALIEKASADSARYTRELIVSYDYLAYYYLKNKDYVQAKAHYEKLLALDPKNENAQEALKVLKKY